MCKIILVNLLTILSISISAMGLEVNQESSSVVAKEVKINFTVNDMIKNMAQSDLELRLLRA